MCRAFSFRSALTTLLSGLVLPALLLATLLLVLVIWVWIAHGLLPSLLTP